jgi:hypothetical protein
MACFSSLVNRTRRPLVGWLAIAACVVAGCGVNEDPQLQSLDERGVRYLLNEQGEVRGLYLYNEPKHPIRDEDVAVVREFPQITLLLIESPHVTDAALQHVKTLANLEELDLAFCSGTGTDGGERTGGITDAGASQLQEMKGLKRIGLQATRVTDAGADRLQRALPDCVVDFNYSDAIVAAMWANKGDVVKALRQLGAAVEFDDDGRVIDLKFGTTDLALYYVGQLESLKSLTLFGRFTGDGLQHLAGLPQLESLDLTDPSGQRQFDAKAIEAIASLRELTSLTLSGNRLQDQQLPVLEKLSRLQTLNVVGCPLSDGALQKLKQSLPDCEITHSSDPLLNALLNNGGDVPAAVEQVAHGVERNDAGQIVGVEFRLSQISDKGLEEVRKLDALERLECVYCRSLTDAGMEHVRQMTGLKRLTLSHTRISNVGVARISKVSDLEQLDLSTSRVVMRQVRPVDDGAMLDVAGMKQLRRLSLKGTEISDTGLRRLEGLARLAALDVRGTRVTEEAVERFKERLPQCNVRF